MNQFAAPPQNWPKSRPQISDQIAIIKYFEFIKFNIFRNTLFVKINYFLSRKNEKVHSEASLLQIEIDWKKED